MKTFQFLLLIFIAQSLVTTAFAKTDASAFMTPRDLLLDSPVSNISLRNNRSASVTAYGIYVRQYAYVTPGSNCNSATVIYPTADPNTQNITAGSIVAPTIINAGKSVTIGSNYLYNMIYEAIYFSTIMALPYACQLPGCTWGNDSTSYNWCIFLGALAPVTTTAGYTANVPPSTAKASNIGLYDYNLVTNYIALGPISCNDQTLTCVAASPQTQSIS